jgi:glycosyltransferase involved in cell wall biosynthesis
VVKLRICVIAPFGLHDDRADAIRLRELFEQMAKKSHSITYVGMGKAPESIPMIRQYAIHVPKLRRAWWPAFSALGALFAFILDAVYRFDVFYFADILTPFFGELILKNLARKKVVLEVNGIFSEELVRVRGSPPRRFIRRAILRFESHVLRNLSLCICVCEWLRREVVRRGVDQGKAVVVPNGVDLEVFNPALEGKEVILKYGLGGYRVVTFVGAFTDQHDISLLVRSVKLVREARNDVRLLLVGDGPTKRKVEKLARDLGLKQDVVFAGRVPHGAVPQILAASDVAVAPLVRSATVQEMIPLKVLEYWAMARPVVTTEAGVGGIPEAHNGQNVLIVDEESSSMADGIVRVLDDRELASRLGENGRSETERKYNWQNIANQTATVLAQLD